MPQDARAASPAIQSLDILDSYDLKGSVALELRFAEGARATKDIDIGVPVERKKRLRAFQDAFTLGFDDFTFLLKRKPLNMDKVDAVRLELAIRYRTRAWQTIVPPGRSGIELDWLSDNTISMVTLE